MIYVDTSGEWSLADLAHFVEPVEISDANGKLIGLFVPANLERGKELYDKAATLFDPAELDRIEATEQTGRSLQEILTHLKSLESDGQRVVPETGAGMGVGKGECATP
jgi:hypothetical protein